MLLSKDSEYAEEIYKKDAQGFVIYRLNTTESDKRK
jgi:hypothetical protein